MRPSCIPVGDEYIATIRRGREEETVGAERYPSSLLAIKAAQRAIDALAPKPAPIEIPREDAQIAEWRRRRSDEQNALTDAFRLQGIEVVRKRRRLSGPNDPR